MGQKQKWYTQFLIYAFRGFTFHLPAGRNKHMVMINIPDCAGRSINQELCNNKDTWIHTVEAEDQPFALLLLIMTILCDITKLLF